MSMKTNPESSGQDLEFLAGQAAALDVTVIEDGADAPVDAPVDALVVGPSNAQLIAGIIETIRDAFCGFTKLSTPRAVLTPAAVEMVAEPWARVLDARGISLHEYLGKNSDMLAAVVATVPVAMALYRAVGAELMVREFNAAEAKRASVKPVPVTVDGVV